MAYIAILLEGYPGRQACKRREGMESLYAIQPFSVRAIWKDTMKLGPGERTIFAIIHCPDLPDEMWEELLAPEMVDVMYDYEKDEMIQAARRPMKWGLNELTLTTKFPLLANKFKRLFSTTDILKQEDLPSIPWEDLKLCFYSFVEDKVVEPTTGSLEPIR